MTKIKLLHGKLLVERKAEESKTSGGLYIPDTAKNKDIGEGTIIQGDDEFKAGTKVIFNKYAGTDIKLDDKEYLIIDPRDLFAVYDN